MYIMSQNGRIVSNTMLELGDTIRCADADDAVDTMTALQGRGVETDFLYKLHGQKGLWQRDHSEAEGGSRE